MTNEKKPFHQVMIDDFLKPRLFSMNSRADKLETEAATLYTKATVIRSEANLLEADLYRYMESRAEQFPDD